MIESQRKKIEEYESIIVELGKFSANKNILNKLSFENRQLLTTLVDLNEEPIVLKTEEDNVTEEEMKEDEENIKAVQAELGNGVVEEEKLDS